MKDIDVNNPDFEVNEYIFVWKNDGWWLKISSPAELFNYHDKTDSRWGQAFSNLMDSVEFGRGETHADALAYAIGMYGAKNRLNAPTAIASFRANIIKAQLDLLFAGNVLYINPLGGYHFGKREEKPYNNFCRSDKLIFPDYSERDIRIKQFPDGEHWYAYIGSVQIKDGDTTKWYSYEDAYKKALEYVTNTAGLEEDLEKEE